MFNGKKISIFNIIFILALLIAFFYLFKLSLDFLKFSLYFLFLLIGGFGFLTLFNLDLKNQNLYPLFALLAGISLNLIIFLLLKVIKFNYIQSFFILFIFGVLLIILNWDKAKYYLSHVDFYKDKLLIIVILLVFFSFFLLSDSVYYLEDSITISDPGNPPIDLTSAQSLEFDFPFPDLAYLGKTLKSHFGYMIILYQLTNYFKIDKINLIYNIMPAFLLILMFFFINELSKAIKGLRLRFLFITAVFFSSIGFISLVPPYLTGFVLIDTINNFNLSLLMLLVLFILIQLDKRSPILECIFVTSMTIIKSPFLIPIAGCYFLSSLESLIRNRDPNNFLIKNMIILPGIAYFLFFVMGTESEIFWVIFPGYYNLASTTLEKGDLWINAIVSFFIIIIGFIGIGLLYLSNLIKKIFKDISQFSLDNPNYFFFSIILVSYILGTFLSDVTYMNGLIFLSPGYMLLSLLTYKFLLNEWDKKKLAVFLILLLLVLNIYMTIGVSYFYQSSKLLLDKKTPEQNNMFANLKRELTEKLVSISHSFESIKIKRCHYSKDLLEGLEILSKERFGVLTFNRLYESCEDYNLDKWEPNAATGFIRTALSKKQAVIEGQESRSIISQKDYCNRTFETMQFFTIINGDEQMFKDYLHYMSSFNFIRFEDLSYYNYFKKYNPSNKTLFIANQLFSECISKKPDVINLTYSQKLDILKDYITMYNVKYILFEREDKPLNNYIESLNLVMLYDSNTVRIYKIRDNH